jgi:hypothetical protein
MNIIWSLPLTMIEIFNKQGMFVLHDKCYNALSPLCNNHSLGTYYTQGLSEIFKNIYGSWFLNLKLGLQLLGNL